MGMCASAYIVASAIVPALDLFMPLNCTRSLVILPAGSIQGNAVIIMESSYTPYVRMIWTQHKTPTFQALFVWFK